MATALERFDAKWGGGEQPAVQLQTTPPPPATNTTPALQAFDQKWGVNAPPTELTATPQLDLTESRGRRDLAGQLIPIDQDSGIPVGDYWNVSTQSDPEAKAQALQKLYPDRKVRVLDTGDVTLEVVGGDGKPKDVVINPRGVGREDLLDLASQAPEIAASIATAVLTQGRGPLRTTAQIVLSALAGGAVGAARDLGERSFAGIDVRPGDIFQERGTQVGVDTALGGLGAVAGKSTRIASPFAREVKPGSLTFNLREGSDFLKKHYGLDLEFTPGQRTGNPSLLALEASEAPMPGSRSVMGKLAERNEAKLQNLQQVATGAILPEEEVGKGIISTLRRAIVEPLEEAVTKAREQAIAKGDKRVVDLLDDALGTPQGARVDFATAGQRGLQAFNDRMAQAQAAVDEAYARVNELPGGTGNVIGGSPAANAAAEIRKELPNVLKRVEKPTGLTDEFGQPLMQEVEQEQVLTSGVPEGLLKALSDLESLRGGKVSLQTLTNMKKAAYDAIAAFKTAHGDVKDRWFTKIAQAYETGIQEGIDATSNLDLKQALATARDTYKKELVPFERAGVKELAKDAFDAGRLTPEEFTSRLFTGPKSAENFAMLSEMLGKDSPAIRTLKRAWGDTVLAEATDDALGTLDPGKLAATLKDMDTHNTRLARELFGANYKALMTTLKLRAGAEGLERLDQSAVKSLLSLKDPTVADFETLVKATVTRDKAYVNDILKNVADGLPLEDFNPTQIVSKLRSARTPTEHVTQILDALPREQRDALATAEFYRLLTEASVSEGATAFKALKGQPINISPTKLVKAYGKGEDALRTTLLLGEDLPAPGAKPPTLPAGSTPAEKGASRVDVIEALVKTLAPKEAAKTAFHNMAGLRSGMAVADLLNNGPLSYASGFAKRALLATAYVKGLGNALTNTRFDAETSAVVANTLIASEPFLRASAEAFGSERTQQVVGELKQSIDRFLWEWRESPEGRKQAANRRFLQGQPTPMKMEARP